MSLDPIAGEVRIAGRVWPVRLDCSRSRAWLDMGAAQCEVRALSWGQKRRLAGVAGLGARFLKRQMVIACTDLRDVPAEENEVDALWTVAAWLSGPGGESLPFEQGLLADVSLDVSRWTGWTLTALDECEVGDIESMWRLCPAPEGEGEGASQPGSRMRPSRVSSRSGGVRSAHGEAVRKIVIVPDEAAPAADSRSVPTPASAVAQSSHEVTSTQATEVECAPPDAGSGPVLSSKELGIPDSSTGFSTRSSISPSLPPAAVRALSTAPATLESDTVSRDGSASVAASRHLEVGPEDAGQRRRAWMLGKRQRAERSRPGMFRLLYPVQAAEQAAPHAPSSPDASRSLARAKGQEGPSAHLKGRIDEGLGEAAPASILTSAQLPMAIAWTDGSLPPNLPAPPEASPALMAAPAVGEALLEVLADRLEEAAAAVGIDPYL